MQLERTTATARAGGYTFIQQTNVELNSTKKGVPIQTSTGNRTISWGSFTSQSSQFVQEKTAPERNLHKNHSIQKPQAIILISMYTDRA